ncbi:MAG: hypothetical protein GC160_22760 [Acidobacteria bacterium]|nr:hypothetical protein [Acidobacteriota bacterium]
MLPLLLLALTVSADFEGGNIGPVEQVADDHVRVHVNGESDQDGRNHQPSWFYFQLDGVKGRTVTVDIGGLEGEYNYRKHDGSGLRNTLPSYSFDNQRWRAVETSEWLTDPSRIRIRIEAGDADRVWIARQPPYTFSRLEALLDDLAGPALRREIVGRSPQGRPLWLLSVTDPAAPDEGKKTVWLMARQHSWESGTSWALEGALRFLASDDPEAAALRRTTLFRIIPMPDPDGVARGGVRFNRSGYDINRNWDTANPEKMPEIFALRAQIRQWLDAGRAIDVFLTLHNTERVDYIQGGLERGGDRVRSMAAYIWEELSRRTHFHSPEGPRESLAQQPDPGRQTVDQWLTLERGVPAYLIELMVDRNPKIARPPSVEDRLSFGRELAKILAEAAAKY